MASEIRIAPDDNERPQWQGLVWSWFLRHTYYVHPGEQLRITLSPAQAVNILQIAAKPSIERLHLRQLFAQGRRYFIEKREDGNITMRTVSNVFWLPRGKTYPTASLYGTFESLDDDTTLLRLRSRIRFWHVIRNFFWPLFMTSMLVYMSWHPVIIVGLIVTLFGLAWAISRLTAQIEAYEMVNFVEKALEDFEPEPPKRLQPSAADVVMGDTQRDFADAWDKFYETVQD